MKRLLLILGLVLVLITATVSISGYLTWDSGTYHLMVRTLYDTGGFSIQNGYAELRSPLLAVGQTTVQDGHLAAQYPEYYTLLSLPFYALFGYRGFMILNAVAFVGICALIWRMAHWFSAERNAPAAAVIVYAFSTYAIEFTQSAYPHLASTFLICASAWLLWGAALEKDDLPPPLPGFVRTAVGRCALAGMVLGIAIGVRLDSVFAGLALAVPLVAFRTLEWRSMAACAGGGLISLLGLAWINAIKFGVFLPFSYGREGEGGYTGSLTSYIPIAIVFAFGVAILAWHRARPIRPGRRMVALLFIAAAITLASTYYGQRLIHGVFQIVVDMRVRPEIPEPGLSRSAGGAVVYVGHVKKSLLESCPYLVLILIPATGGLLRGTYGARWLLWLVPGGFIGFYGFLAWHGSVGWNMRYLNPTLPFLALLASHELLRRREHIPDRRLLFWAGIAALWILLAVTFLLTSGSLRLQEMIILNGGLLLAALLLSCQAMELLVPEACSRHCSKALSGILVVALVWASALTFAVDYPLGSGVRQYYLRAARDIQPQVQDGALIMAFQPDYVWGLLDTGIHPVIADYTLGTEEDAVGLIQKAVGRIPVYWLSPSPGGDHMSEPVFDELRSKNIRVEPVLHASSERPYRLFELSEAGIERR